MADDKAAHDAPSLTELNRHLFASLLPDTHGTAPTAKKGKKAAAESTEQHPDTTDSQG